MKPRQKTGYGLLILSGLFLWNPTVGMLDYLPDFIGYLLLLCGLALVSDLLEPIWEAREKMRAAVWLALAEFGAQLLVRFFLSASSSGDVHGQNGPMWILLFSFVTAVLECYFLIPAYRKLFFGLGRLAEIKQANHLKWDRRGRSPYDRMATFSVVFVIGKNLLALLPELSSLSTYEYYEAENPLVRTDYYAYISGIRFLLLIPALILTVWWLVRWIILFASAKRDSAFQAAVRKDYEEKILSDQSLLQKRAVRRAFLFVKLGAAFLPTLLFARDALAEDLASPFGVELLPDFASVLFLAVGIFLLGKVMRPRRSELLLCAVAFCAGLFEWIAGIVVFQKYSVGTLRLEKTPPVAVVVLLCAGILSAVLTSLCFFLFLWRLQKSINGEPASDRPFTKLFVLLAIITAGKILNWVLFLRVAWLWWIPLIFTVVFVFVLSPMLAEVTGKLLTARAKKIE